MMMSEKENEKKKEKEEEREILDHFYHPHPLRLTVAGSRSNICYGCPRMIYPKETAYTCRDECGSDVILHEECAEMPREISLSMHPQHTLIQKEVRYVPTCAVCKDDIDRIGYYCTSSDPCGFQVHVGCALNIEVVKTCIHHPSHPQHQLTLQRRSCSFKCDACGIKKKGNSSYICSDCQYWIHESCAALPPSKDFPHLHHHHLSLIYQLPLDYIKFVFKCDICFQDLRPRYWVYHCQTCRYVVHVNCATTNNIISNINAVADEDNVIAFPLTDNAVEDLIESFVTKAGEVVANPNGHYKFHNHDHELHLISPALQLQLHDEEEVVNDEDEDDDDDDLSYGKKSELVCDGCTMPINSSKKYMSCGECKYFLHLPCSQLPLHLPSHPLHPQPNHDLILQTTPKPHFTDCDICWFPTNGLFYKCTKCSDFAVDIKCLLSLPDTIKHKAHPYHHLKLLDKHTTANYYYSQRLCAACGHIIYGRYAYICDRSCQIFLHASCAMLPASVTNPTWDKHPLPLTFDATVNRPGDFYCDVCEKEMHPKRWMYHCRHCDVSIHPKCFPTASGEYRNIKFGQRYLFAGVHQHPLAHQLLPLTKPRCDVCGERKEYGTHGFQCDSHKCNFFMCYFWCGEDRRQARQAVD